MRALVFSATKYEIEAFERAMFGLDSGGANAVQLEYFSGRLTARTAALAEGFSAVSAAVGDRVNADVMNELARRGVRLIAVRGSSVGNVDVERAHKINMKVTRVTSLASYSIAEFAVALVLSLAKKTHKAYSRVRDGNLDLNGLLGFELHNKTVGLIGTGKAGVLTGKILRGFGCKILAYDVFENQTVLNMGGKYVKLEQLLAESDIVSLHAPLLPATKNMINEETLGLMKSGALLINTSKSGLLDIASVVSALQSGRLGGLGWDVGDSEADLFRVEPSGQMVAVDDSLKTIVTLPNVLITGHQAAHTDIAVESTAKTTLETLLELSSGRRLTCEVRPDS